MVQICLSQAKRQFSKLVDRAVNGEEIIIVKRGKLMCQHFSGHMVKQLFAAIRSQLATHTHWLNAFALYCKRPQCIQIQPV